VLHAPEFLSVNRKVDNSDLRALEHNVDFSNEHGRFSLHSSKSTGRMFVVLEEDNGASARLCAYFVTRASFHFDQRTQ
jgi:hypothetical protein